MDFFFNEHHNIGVENIVRFPGEIAVISIET